MHPKMSSSNSSSEMSSSTLELLQEKPRHSLHDIVQFNPSVLHVQQLISQFPLQPHRITCEKSSGPAPSSVSIGAKDCSFFFQGQFIA